MHAFQAARLEAGSRLNAKASQSGVMAYVRELLGWSPVLIVIGTAAVAMVIVLAIQRYYYPPDSAERYQEPVMRFVIMGDYSRGEQTKHQQEVARVMAQWCQKDDLLPIPNPLSKAPKNKCDFVISTGDNFGPSGVTADDDVKFTDYFEHVYTKELFGEQTKFYHVLGDKDLLGSGRSQVAYAGKDLNDAFVLDDKHLYDQVMSVSKTYLGKTTTLKAQVFFLDTVSLISKYRNETAYPQYVGKLRDENVLLSDLKQRLAAIPMVKDGHLVSGQQVNWKIVVGHHPALSGGRNAADGVELRKKLLPAMFTNGVQFYLSGHDNNMQYLLDKNDESQVTESGDRYNLRHLVSGSADTFRRLTDDGLNLPQLMAYADETPGFVFVRLQRSKLYFEFVSSKGSVLFKNTILNEFA